MGQYSNEAWYLKLSTENMKQYGDVPPPWIYAPRSHPYSMRWRMGGGETYIMVLSEWLDQQHFSEEERIAYVKKYPAPPRWLSWVADFIWELDADTDIDYAPYFSKMAQLGFEGIANFEEDFGSDEWE